MNAPEAAVAEATRRENERCAAVIAVIAFIRDEFAIDLDEVAAIRGYGSVPDIIGHARTELTLIRQHIAAAPCDRARD